MKKDHTRIKKFVVDKLQTHQVYSYFIGFFTCIIIMAFCGYFSDKRKCIKFNEQYEKSINKTKNRK